MLFHEVKDSLLYAIKPRQMNDLKKIYFAQANAACSGRFYGPPKHGINGMVA
jgi:hypothetical protein